MSKQKGYGIGLSIDPEDRAKWARERRLKQWAETHPDDVLAADIEAYIAQTTHDLKIMCDGYSSALKDEREEASKMAKGVIRAMRKMEAEGRLIPLCKQFTFKPDNGGWLVGAPKAKPVFIYNTDGMQHLHELITKPNTAIKCTDLERLDESGCYIPEDIPQLEEDDIQRIKRQISTLEGKYQSAIKEDDYGRAAAHDREKDALMDHYGKYFTNRGKPRVTGELNKSRQRVAYAIKVALKNINAEVPAVHDEIKKHLSTGTECFYFGATPWSV